MANCAENSHRTCGAGHFNSHLAFGLHLQVHRLLNALDCLQVLCIRECAGFPSGVVYQRVRWIACSFAAVELCRGTLTESSPLDEPGLSNQPSSLIVPIHMASRCLRLAPQPSIRCIDTHQPPSLIVPAQRASRCLRLAPQPSIRNANVIGRRLPCRKS